MSFTAYASAAEFKGPGLMTRMGQLLHPMRWFRRRMVRRPGSTLAMTAAAIFSGVITVNALALQTERHPAPMFTALQAPNAVETVAVTQPPVAAAQPGTQPMPVPVPVPVERRAEPRQPKPAPAPVVNPKDQMLAIIKTTGSTTETAAEQPSQRMVLVQRALNKAGYGPLKEDGAFGAASRQALEKFEADRKLAVRGEPQGRTLRELSRASGIAIE